MSVTDGQTTYHAIDSLQHGCCTSKTGSNTSSNIFGWSFTMSTRDRSFVGSKSDVNICVVD